MKRSLTFLAMTLIVAILIPISIFAAEPVVSLNFENADGITLNEAELVSDETRGNALKISGMGYGTQGSSYALYTTDIFGGTDMSNGMTFQIWYMTSASKTLCGTAPIVSFDMAANGYIALTTSLEVTVNSTGNDEAGAGYSPTCWCDPVNVGGGENATPFGVWQCATVRISGDGIDIFVNGELKSSTTVNNGTMHDLIAQLSHISAVRFGSWQCSWWNYGDYEGCIGDFKVFATALTDEEIGNEYKDSYIEQTVFGPTEVSDNILYDDTPLVDPVAYFDFENGDNGFELYDAELESGTERGTSLHIYGLGAATNGMSSATLTTDLFAETDWSDGLSVSLWCKADESSTLHGSAPLFAIDIANVGYIGAVASCEAAVNTTGNDDSLGIGTTYWTDPRNVGGGVNETSSSEWTNVVVSFGKNSFGKDGIAVYVNGELKQNQAFGNGGTVAEFLSEVVNAYSLRLGSWLCSWWNYGDYEGLIDDVAIYNVSLTPGQANKIYNASTSAAEAVSETEAPAQEDVMTETEDTTPAESEAETEEVIETAETIPEEEVVSDETAASEEKAPQTFDKLIVLTAVALVSGSCILIILERKKHNA